MERLTKIKSESLRTQVYSQLKNSLIAGVWKPGERIPSEKELCDTFGVSRVTVRAAIQQLEILGLVTTRQGNGTTVNDFSSTHNFDAFHPIMQVKKNQDLLHILEYRKILETGTISLAIERISDDDIAYLKKKLKEMQNSVDDHVQNAKADHAFHHRIAQSTKNPIIVKVYDLINEMISTAMVDVVDMIGTERGLRYHKLLLDAISVRDAEACSKLMESHIQETINAVIEHSDRSLLIS